MKQINLGSVQLPIESATKTFAILAKRGAGKTYTAAVLAEEFYKVGVPFVVIDPIDVWWGLKLKADGKTPGIPVVVFGIDHADIPLDRDMGREIAQAIVRENISCVISTFGMPKVGQRKFMADFGEEILRINDTPRHIFIEEAHEFVPQRILGPMGASFNAVANLVVMGRNRGLGVTLINQRAATINKDVLTQLDTLLAFRNVAPQDRQALKEWVEYHEADGNFSEFMDSLPSLPTGEGWIWSPEFLEVFKRIKIRTRETFHPDREKLGIKFEMPKLQQKDVQSFIQNFNQHLEKPKILKDELPLITQRKMAKEKKWIGEEIKLPQVKTLKGQAMGFSNLVVAVNLLQKENKKLKSDHLVEIKIKNDKILDLQKKLDQIAKIVGTHSDIVNTAKIGKFISPHTQSTQENIEMWAAKLPGASAKILRLLADKYPMKFTRAQIALQAGIKYKGSTFRAYMAALKRNSLVLEQGGEVSLNPGLL